MLLSLLSNRGLLIDNLEHLFILFIANECIALLKWSRDLIVIIQLHLLKNYVSFLVDNITVSVDEVTTSVHTTASFIYEFWTTCFTDNDKVTKVVLVKVTHDIS